MPTVLITGAGRGLGLEFVRQYAAQGWRVHACARRPEKAEASKGEVLTHPLDVRDAGQIAALRDALAGEAIDLLINNAGIYGPRGASIANVSDADWLEVFHVNSVAPLRVASALAENVAKSGLKLMVFITSQLGSIARMGAGVQPYRMSKAALNAGVRGLSLELAGRGITSVVFHPGWVRTDMGGAGAALDPKTSIAGMRAVIARLKASDNGRFLDYDGAEIPW
ncbi:MAG TPA: SDR family oxidoreductase [Alphaproteobacteria bacterium]|nr:SDR family oxidoreductase [Alphaproteobacteria bacterium]